MSEKIMEIVREIRKDKKPYALKIARELDKADGDKLLNSTAAQCLRDDCDYIKQLADRIEDAYKRKMNKLLSILDDAGHIVAAFMRRRHGDILVTERGKFVKLVKASETLKRIDSVLDQKTEARNEMSCT